MTPVEKACVQHRRATRRYIVVRARECERRLREAEVAALFGLDVLAFGWRNAAMRSSAAAFLAAATL